ncbi:MAG: LicD family protein [Lachnospiraceae bacterium]|nr:LicD family protein [Lachnospiraceae bacterium]
MGKYDNISLEPEVRCDHEVTTEIKKLWNIELDLYDQLERICKKYGLKYFAVGGTLLGAVRHQGFIPWDDDMDFGLLWDDYVRFCEVAPKELEYPYFFQSYETGDCYWPDLVRIRRSDTTGTTKRGINGYFPPYNFGIWIDIFPFNGVPNPADSKAFRRHAHQIALYKKAIACRMRHRRAQLQGKRSLRNYMGKSFLLWKTLGAGTKDYKGLCDRFMRLLSKYEDSDYVSVSGFAPGSEKYTWRRGIFKDTVLLPFENKIIPCPAGYEEYLTHTYGDYMEFVKGAAEHTMPILDPDVPYTEKLADLIENFGKK